MHHQNEIEENAETKLYMAFIKKQMPNAEVVRTGGYYKINLKEFTRDLYNRKGIEGAEDYQWHHPTDVDHPIHPTYTRSTPNSTSNLNHNLHCKLHPIYTQSTPNLRLT